MASSKPKPIFVADDLSSESTGRARSDAIRVFALQLSHHLQAPLHLGHVLKNVKWAPVSSAASASLIQQAIQEKEGELKRAAASLNARPVFLKGDPVEQLLRVASKSYEMIIMGTHGYRGFNRILIGSVSEEVIRRSRIPVMTINPVVIQNIRGLRGSLVVLVPTSLTKNSDTSENYAASFAKRIGAKVVLFHNLFESLHPLMQAGLKSSRAGEFEDAFKKMKSYALRQLETRAKTFRKRGVDVSIYLDDNTESSSESILNEVKKSEASFVITGTHGRSLGSKVFLGRTVRVVILDSPVPVIVVHS